uniref:3'-5' exonuclease domain-containing protein n=1 Tax=Salix viminalis TaxID=40686 RepID=A0A6N2MJN0_SALVM
MKLLIPSYSWLQNQFFLLMDKRTFALDLLQQDKSVGLDIEWRPNRSRLFENPVATLQLTAGNDCLIFQLLYCPTEFESDAKKLMDDYGLSVGNAVDLRGLAAEKLGDLRLAREVLGKGVEKPKRITLSRWDNAWLSAAQVQYACFDAFLSWKIGESLLAA